MPTIAPYWLPGDTEIRYLRIRDEEGGQIRVIELSRPAERNAWTETMRNELAYSLDVASKDKAVRVVVITGDPRGGMFCAGMDLTDAGGPKSIQKGGKGTGIMPGDTPEGRRANLQYARDGGGTAGLAIMRCTKPVIAAVNGSAVGVGMTLPVCCDMSVADGEAKVGFVFGRRGLTMEALSSTLLARRVGHAKAMELVLTARVFKAKDAPPGLFNYTTPKGGALAKAMELAREVCDTAPMSAMLNRFMILRNFGTSPEEAHLIESKAIMSSTNIDSREGIMSFLERRKPKWRADPFADAPDFVPWWSEVQTKAKL